MQPVPAPAGPAGAQVGSADRFEGLAEVLGHSSASGSCSPVERPGCRGDSYLPAEPVEAPFKIRRAMGDLHELIGATIVKPAPDRRGRFAFHELVGRTVPVVGKE